MVRWSLARSILLSTVLSVSGAFAHEGAMVLARQLIPVSQELVRAAMILKADPGILALHYPVGGDIAFDAAHQAHRFSALLQARPGLSDAELLAVVAMLPRSVQHSLAQQPLPQMEASVEFLPGPRPHPVRVTQPGSPVAWSGPRTTMTSLSNLPTHVSNLPEPSDIQAAIGRADGPRETLDVLRGTLTRIRMILTEVSPGETPIVEMDGAGNFLPTSRFAGITEEARGLLLSDLTLVEAQFHEVVTQQGMLDYHGTGTYTAGDAARGRVMQKVLRDVDRLRAFLTRSDLQVRGEPTRLCGVKPCQQ